jgi:fumarate hydratase class II
VTLLADNQLPAAAHPEMNDRNTALMQELLYSAAHADDIGARDKASAIAHDADRTGRTLRESALDSGAITAEDFDRIVNPATMVGPF